MPKLSSMSSFSPSEDSPVKLNGNQPSVVETIKSIDNNHLLQIQEIKIDLHKGGEQEKYSEHDVNKVLNVKRVPASKPIPSKRCYNYVVRARPQASLL